MVESEENMLTVSYFSAGVSSAVATKLMVSDIDKIVYTHIDDQHEDTMRFVKDCEKWYGMEIEINQSPYKSVENVIRQMRYFRARNGRGSACTSRLKREVRKEFEQKNMGRMRCVWGFDCDEAHRCERVRESMPYHDHIFPLVDARITKAEAHRMLTAAGIRRPAMYDLGYHNNNCIGCVRGGIGYWNRIRIDFPDVYESRSKLERDIRFPILGKDTWLDELDPERGRHAPPICGECGILCELMRSDLD
jgi:3'-phosphoadenosine 5'-phosphosulfate sulfotransferase (PAPS reductase)/FAD synthetase